MRHLRCETGVLERHLVLLVVARLPPGMVSGLDGRRAAAGLDLLVACGTGAARSLVSSGAALICCNGLRAGAGLLDDDTRSGTAPRVTRRDGASLC